jgi:hypothetical protein
MDRGGRRFDYKACKWRADARTSHASQLTIYLISSPVIEAIKMSEPAELE